MAGDPSLMDPSPPAEGEPRWLRQLRNARAGFDLIFPPVLLTCSLVFAGIILFGGGAAQVDPSVQGIVGVLVAAIAGLALRRR